MCSGATSGGADVELDLELSLVSGIAAGSPVQTFPSRRRHLALRRADLRREERLAPDVEELAERVDLSGSATRCG